MTEVDRPALAALLDRAGMTGGDFWNVETWAAALILANAVRENDPRDGVDRALLAAGKPTEGLETFAEQFGRFDQLAAADQRALLAGVAHEAAQDRAEARVVAWLTGDLAALEAEMAGGYLDRPALREALLGARNRLFAARIAVRLEQGRRPFVAVGTGHMLGIDGLPALLSERGYRVRRVQ